MEQTLVTAMCRKIEEQIERSDRLVRLLPLDRLEWSPPVAGAWTAGMLVGHLLECMAGLCAALAAAQPARLAHFSSLRSLPVNHKCPPDEAVRRIAVYRAHIEEGMALLADSDLRRAVPTIFVPRGEPLLTLLLGNLEHLINHKHQLFTYLKLMGVDVATRDLYRFRGE